MTLMDLETYIQTKKKLDLRISLYYSVIVGVILFILPLLGGSFVGGLVAGILSFGFLFGLVYGLLYLQGNSVAKKLRNMDVDGVYLVVTYMNELGVLVLNQDKVVYHALLAMSNNKKIELPVTEDLFMAFGEYRRKKRDQYKYGDIQKCHITFREMPHGMVRQFSFYNIDGVIDRVGERLNEISVFNAEKYQ